MAKDYVLNEADRELVQRYLRGQQSRPEEPGRTNNHHVGDEVFKSDNFVALTPDGGIPARVGGTVGTATCRVYQIIDGEIADAPFGDIDVFNLSTTEVEGGQYVRVIREKYGAFVVDVVGVTETHTLVTAVTCLGGTLTVYSADFNVNMVAGSEITDVG